MKIAIMQPYLFPYIGYFQLIHAVDKFVFYDDVNYIKGGWINRNKILINGSESLFTIPLENASSFKQINQTKISSALYPKWEKKLLTTIERSYKKAPYYERTLSLIKTIFNQQHKTISNLATTSIIHICDYIEISTAFELSSLKYTGSKGMDKADRLIAICNKNKSSHYINPSGGSEIYKKDDFLKQGIKLNFIKNNIIAYKQFNDNFVPSLSIIDILMFNDVNDVKKMLNEYNLL